MENRTIVQTSAKNFDDLLDTFKALDNTIMEALS